MADERTANPRGPTPATYDSRLGEAGHCARRSLVEELGEIADEIRQIAADPDIGMRPYTVHIVRIRWTGGEAGRGVPAVALDLPLLPTPRVSMTGLSRDSREGGVLERGDARVDGISARYTEDELEGYFAAAEGEEAFVEIRIDERDGVTKRRRFTLSRPPIRRPGRFDWVLVLARQDGERQRSGAPRDDARRAVGQWPIA